MPAARKRPCAICRRWFRPDARIGSRQHACGKPECQTSRRQKTQASWRRRNPGYAIAYRIDQRAAQTESPPEPLRMPAPLNQLPWDMIGIGAAVTRRPLPHHRAYGSVHGGSSRLRWHSSNKDGMRAGFSVPVIAPDGSAPSLPASRASPISAEEKSSSIWQTHALPLHQHRLMQAIVNCRTAALGLGGAVEWCDHCQNTRIVYRSCRDRHCPKCQALARERWIQQRLAELLPVEYFHVVFTVPEQIAAIAFYNKVVVYQILFRTVAATLLTIARDPQHLGAEIGFFAVLHTWGQNLHRHPHLHCVVPGGGLSPDGEWKACLPGFFLPVRVSPTSVW